MVNAQTGIGKGLDPIWVSVGEDLTGNPATYRAFKGETACDDCSEELALPFEFAFFGETYSRVFINSNGNLTFGEEWTEFTPSPFCLAGPKMVSPFYADADLSQCGSIDYFIADHYLVVTWTAVCHFHGNSNYTGLENTFQVIISDETLTEVRGQKLPVGATVLFNYRDMQWTTGQSSGSLTGFEGAAATVGLNSGDGSTCDDYGIFDHEGTDYQGYTIGHSDLANGVSHLDFITLVFNGKTGTYLDPENPALPQPEGNPFSTEISSLSAWPNPFADQMTVTLEAAEDQPARLLVVDASGKPVHQEKRPVVIGTNDFQVTLAGLPKGLYYLSVTQGSNRAGMQVVKL
jgi:hypothetical protein